ncbi:MAG: hypothetical protein IT492_09155 [Gammaproteobacteria bacterium]|jgi:hypothetical protein|nr:hypothetical protein [Gammaproteobacteria bacterium]
MPISYTIDDTHHIVRTVWSGDVTAADVRAHWLVFLDDPLVMALRRTLTDLRGAQLKFSGDELYELIRDVVLPRLGDVGWKTAILVAQPEQFGVSRQYQVFARYSEDSIFHDEAPALAWLLADQ